MLLQDKRGFSLVELLVAMAIIAFVVLGFYAAVIMVIQSNEKSEEFTIATALAQDKMEELETLAAAGTALTSGSDSSSRSGFSVTWTIPNPDVSGLPAGVTSILVKVEWTDGEGKTQSVDLHTIVAEDTAGGSGSSMGGDDDDAR